MESPLSRFERLLTALEQLAGHIDVQLLNKEADGALDCLGRSADLITDLADLSESLRSEGKLPASHLERARRLLAHHERISAVIAAQLKGLGDELRENEQARARLRRMTPAYAPYGPNGAANKASNRLNTSG